MALETHVVSHTHWDREWYHPAERFRQRLIALIDELLSAPPDAPGTVTRPESFLLDGQTVLLDDYLAVCPDRAPALAESLRERRLEAGPWFVLADELIPSGEALVRNLLAGRRALAALSAAAPPALYCPDSFGHPAALPAIAAGFGLPIVVLWRGYGGKRWPAGDTARWIAPNGEGVLLFHLPRDGYEFGSHLPTDERAAQDRWVRMRSELAPRSTTGVMLVLNGADHHARQRGLDAALSALERAGSRDGVQRSSLTRFARRLAERGTSQRLAIVRGELRDSYGYAWTLQGTFATRAHEKRLNATAERLLLREAEPWSALAAYHGTSRRALVQAAWRDLLLAHPHDTLCGCSIDAVASAMEVRLAAAVHQAAGIRDDAVAQLIGYDADTARESRERWRAMVVLRNPVPRARSGVAIVDIDEFIADVAVGPGSAPGKARPRAERPDHGNTLPALGTVQVLKEGARYSRIEAPRHYPDNDLVWRRRVAAWVADAPAYGITAYALDGTVPGRRGPRHPVVSQERSLRNGELLVTVRENGTVSLEQVSGGRRIDSLLSLVDETDAGDLYTPSPRPREREIRFAGVRRVHAGPLRGTLSLRFRIVRPGARRPDARVNVRLVLDADAPFLRISVSGVNYAKTHRLRLAVSTDLSSHSAVVWADAAFGPVRRDPLEVGADETVGETPQPTAPMHRYVSLFTQRDGVTLFSDGLAEYEARADGAILVTLVRAVGQLSRNDIPERPGHAGWPSATPAAQCLGPFRGELAVMFHGPRTGQVVDAIERAADDFLLPITGDTLRSALEVTSPITGVELTGEGLAFSACKESEDGEWLVLRCVNLREEEVSGRWHVPFEIREARLGRLDETIVGEMTASGREVGFRAGGRGICTLLVR